jgi:hypothetical protein
MIFISISLGIDDYHFHMNLVFQLCVVHTKMAQYIKEKGPLIFHMNFM